ncbi:MAG: hypothetical protein ABJA62_02005 [Luteimonas sp.]
MGTTTGVGGTTSIAALNADNNTGTAVNLTCTLVDGESGGTGPNSPNYFPKTLSLPPNSRQNGFLWSAAADNGGNGFINTVNVSCNLPVGVGIGVVVTYFDEDVGA